MDYSHLGPEFGPSEAPWRDNEFIDNCTSTVNFDFSPKEKWIIKESMKCTGCHKEEKIDTAALKFPMHELTFGWRIFNNIINSGYMPAKSKFPLTQPMKKALIQCLKYEYFGGFEDHTLNYGNNKPGILYNYLIPKGCR